LILRAKEETYLVLVVHAVGEETNNNTDTNTNIPILPEEVAKNSLGWYQM
jgi:hypothetical protein